ncbi:D-alanine--D-alanine ligase [Patescibacteria group bacterium]|nr:D-alanine--D-alanine ligase [Patescibacteria group bacterium]MBU1916056.1 D-alanine--D-alanine ligase [Patescibacteria group bacterium]
MSNDNKLNVLLLYGGRSTEHDVSNASAKAVATALNHKHYNVLMVQIGRDGVWRLENGLENGEERWLSTQPGLNYLLNTAGQKAEKIDVVFPLVHGSFGEDGCLQGLLEMSELPYVGSRVLGSALGMDKELQKRVLNFAKIPIAPYVTFKKSDWQLNDQIIIDEIEKSLRYPLFVKPVNLGSSVGISKINDPIELRAGIQTALRFDIKIIVEQGILNAREIECAVLDDLKPQASVLGEIKPDRDFYDYQAKYHSSTTQLIIPAELDEQLAQNLRRLAVQVFTLLEAEGLARVDFLLNAATGEYVVNEINTLPGFTSASMYPKLWTASGLLFPQLLDRLISLALTRSKIKAELVREFISK